MSDFIKLQQFRQQHFQPSIPFQEVFKKKEVQQPKYKCNSCANCEVKRCSFLNRPVEPDFNRCFNHSNYHPVSSQCIAEEELRKSA